MREYFVSFSLTFNILQSEKTSGFNPWFRIAQSNLLCR